MRDVVYSPPHSVDEARADLFDVNSDGLADLIVTDPARYRTASGQPAVGVFFNGFEGSDARPAGAAATFSDAVPLAIPPGKSSVLSLQNLNVVPMDIDGDGRSDLLHMPRVATYGSGRSDRGLTLNDDSVGRVRGRGVRPRRLSAVRRDERSTRLAMRRWRVRAPLMASGALPAAVASSSARERR